MVVRPGLLYRTKWC